MSAEIFTQGWADEWCAKINTNDAYRKAAARWEGAIALVMSAQAEMGIPEQRAVVADLWHGDCRTASVADAGALEDAPYVIQATPATWKRVLDGSTDPIVGLMGGKLKLEKGGLFALLPYAQAAKQLVVSAREVDTTFPEGWT